MQDFSLFKPRDDVRDRGFRIHYRYFVPFRSTNKLNHLPSDTTRSYPTQRPSLSLAPILCTAVILRESGWKLVVLGWNLDRTRYAEFLDRRVSLGPPSTRPPVSPQRTRKRITHGGIEDNLTYYHSHRPDLPIM